MTDEKKKKVKRYAAIVIALVLATGALAFSVWRFVATIKKKIDSKNESNEPRITATTDTRNAIPTLNFPGESMFATEKSIFTNQITFTKGTTDGTFVLNVAEAVHADVADTDGYIATGGGSFASITLYIADVGGEPSDSPTVPALTADVWTYIMCDLDSSFSASSLTFNVLKNAEQHATPMAAFCSNEDGLPERASDFYHYVMFAVVPLHKNDGSDTSATGSWQYFHTQFYRMSDLFTIATSGSGGSSAGGYTEADLEAARQQAVADYIKSDLYKHELQEKYDNGHDVGYSEGYANGTREVFESDEYKNGLQAKYDEGYAKGTEDYDRYGAQRYEDGYRYGVTVGRSQVENNVETGKNLFLSILDAPFTLIRNIFNFEILGINVSSVIFFILSVLLIGFAIRKIKG